MVLNLYNIQVQNHHFPQCIYLCDISPIDWRSFNQLHTEKWTKAFYQLCSYIFVGSYVFFFSRISFDETELPINQMSEYQNCTNFQTSKSSKSVKVEINRKQKSPDGFSTNSSQRATVWFCRVQNVTCHWHVLLGVLHYQHFVHNLDAQCDRMTDPQKKISLHFHFHCTYEKHFWLHFHFHCTCRKHFSLHIVAKVSNKAFILQ